MSTKKAKKANKNDVEGRIEFVFPKNNDVASGDIRLNELIAQSHLSVILAAKDGGYPARKLGK